MTHFQAYLELNQKEAALRMERSRIRPKYHVTPNNIQMKWEATMYLNNHLFHEYREWCTVTVCPGEEVHVDTIKKLSTQIRDCVNRQQELAAIIRQEQTEDQFRALLVLMTLDPKFADVIFKA